MNKTPQRRRMDCINSALVAALLIAWSGIAATYPKYQSAEGANDYCSDCHGQFRDVDYVSLKDGTPWGSDLMDGHLGYLSGCDSCHRGSRDFGRVWLNASDNNARPKGCVGCHGRNQDVTSVCTGVSDVIDGIEVECGSGAGLRKHHAQVGITSCAGCHGDGDPLTPVGEDTTPFNYGMNGVGPVDPCNADMSENNFGPTGLDNDGDLLDDGNDPDCGAAVDTDQDTVDDSIDNCTDLANADQFDSNGDGIGNICDPDIVGEFGDTESNNCLVDFFDLGALKAAFLTTPVSPNWNPDADFNNNDLVGFPDVGTMKAFFLAAPGPAANPNAASGCLQ